MKLNKCTQTIKVQGSIGWGITSLILSLFLGGLFIFLGIYVFSIPYKELLGLIIGMVIMSALGLGVTVWLLVLSVRMIINGHLGKIIIRNGSLSTCTVTNIKYAPRGGKSFTVSYKSESGELRIIRVDKNAFQANHIGIGQILSCYIYGEDCYVLM